MTMIRTITILNHFLALLALVLVVLVPYPHLCGGFHSHGDPPIAGWFLSWKIPIVQMDDLGVPL